MRKHTAQRRHKTLLVTDHDSLTRVLLQDNTVPQLAHQGIPVRAQANVNPFCRDVASPSRSRQSKELSPLRHTVVSRCVGTSTAGHGGYSLYHQLQCPMCQSAARASYDGQCNALFAAETDARGRITRKEASFRREMFQSMMRDRWALHSSETSCIDNMSCVLDTSKIASEVADLTAEEHGQRMALVRLLWRQLRAMHFAADALNRHSNTPCATQVEALASATLQRTNELANVYDSRQVEYHYRQHALTLCEAASRMQLTETYATATSLLEIAACGWKLSASKSQEQRLVCEQADERNKFCALEARIRLMIDSEASSCWQSFMKNVRETTSAFVLQALQLAMSNMLIKEERIRADRRTMFLAERETLLIRALVSEEDRRRAHDVHAEGWERKSAVVEPQLEWLASRTDDDIATCRQLLATGLCCNAVDSACLVVLDELPAQ